MNAIRTRSCSFETDVGVTETDVVGVTGKDGETTEDRVGVGLLEPPARGC
jgi:hypothetical protein